MDELTLADVLRLAARRRKAPQPLPRTMRIALLGGYTFRPLADVVEHFLAAEGMEAQYFLGGFDNYTAEILDVAGPLYQFQPQTIVLLPSHERCRYSGRLSDARPLQEAEAKRQAAEIVDLCRTAHARSGAEIILANFALPARHDPGPYRARTLGSEWSFRKLVNLELGLNAPASVHLCDVEFLSARRGTLASEDARGWFESKQPYSAALLLDVGREMAHAIAGLGRGPKKVAVVDLDNTLWGGVVGDDGVEGIELGDTTPRGQAFKAFQRFLQSLTERGVLLAVASKNDEDKAAEAVEQHPEMVLRRRDFASFQANWRPKPDNLRQIALELNLGLESLVFLDDDPAEIEIVRQFAPEVATILLGPDPAEFIGICQDARCFEPVSLTVEDAARADQYRHEAERLGLMAAAPDMDAYLASLRMQASARQFQAIDVPRIAQLINKSNQFNLTLKRRTEAQVQAVMADPGFTGFTLRLADRFGDYGLVAAVILRGDGDGVGIDTWVMSCRVLKRRVEELVLQHIVCLAQARGWRQVRGVYVPGPRNQIVQNLYRDLGFMDGVLDPGTFQPKPLPFS